MSEPNPHPFDELVQLPDCEIRLASAALLFARDAYPHLELPGYLARLDCLADRVDRIGARGPCDRVEAIREVLYEQDEFRGNTDDYYDPRNSYLNQVLDRRRGIPISLSVIWLDIARRLDYPFVGINFPGHFLIRYECPIEPVYVDAFDGGKVLDEEGLRERLKVQIGRVCRIPHEYVAVAGAKDILMRMLNNLLGIYLQQCNWQAAEPVLARQVALSPEDADLWCRRGQVCLNLHQCERAVACFEKSLELTGCHPHASRIHRHLCEARKRIAEKN